MFSIAGKTKLKSHRDPGRLFLFPKVRDLSLTLQDTPLNGAHYFLELHLLSNYKSSLAFSEQKETIMPIATDFLKKKNSVNNWKSW